MIKNTLLVLATLSFAFGILLISVFRTTSVKYEFNPLNPQEATTVLGEKASLVDYYLPYAGRVLPDSPLWPLKSLRDRLWLMTNASPTREAELKLLFADKRIRSAVILYEKGKDEVALSTLTKAEKYLEEAYLDEQKNRANGYETTEFMLKLANASLKHYEVMEYVLPLSSENSHAVIFGMQKIPQKVYEDMRNTLIAKSIAPPENPFNW